MNLESMFQQMLGLNASWKVIRAEFDTKRGIFIVEIQETGKLWEEESKRLAQAVQCYDHVGHLEWRHLNVFSKESIITCNLPRGIRADDQVYRVTPPWEGKNKHFTKEFEAFALTLMREMPVKKAAQILGETDQRLWRMLLKHVEAAYAQISWEDLVWIGADEMNRRKGHNYLTVFADLIKRRVVFATEGKDASVWKAFVDEFARHNGHPKSITQVAIDMSPAYIRGVRDNLGNAQIVFDKFHVISLVNEAVTKVRRLEQQESQMRGELLKKTQWIFRKNPENWTDKEALKLMDLEKENLVTAMAYQMRLNLQGAYESATATEAKKRFIRWCQWVREKAAQSANRLLHPMAQMADMVENHLEGILAHWKQGLTTAYMEGLNSLFSATKRKARGYKSTTYLKTMLYFVAGKLNIPCLTH